MDPGFVPQHTGDGEILQDLATDNDNDGGITSTDDVHPGPGDQTRTAGAGCDSGSSSLSVSEKQFTLSAQESFPLSGIEEIDKINQSGETDEHKMNNITDEKSCKVHEFNESLTVRQRNLKRESNEDKNIEKVADKNSIKQSDTDQNRQETKAYYLAMSILTILSLMTRIYNIEFPAHVCWDETHFGKMGSWYINRKFFFDVHPPLGKMLIGLAGVLSGYDGSFPFSKPGDDYGDTNYVGMRVFCALLGSWLVTLTYQIVWLLTHSIPAGIFAASLVLFDTGTLILSRHILLDPILLFFILLSVYTCLSFLGYRGQPFSLRWWFWMAATGAALASALGVKFVGLFVILLIGFTTATDLWALMANTRVSLFLLCKHVLARLIGLVLVPIIVYSLFFAIHFKVLNQSGNGDGFFSTGFQSQLHGNKLYNVSMPQYMAYGSVVTLKQRRTGGAYLHSHVHLYPEDHPPKQQQVTSYSHKDHNNKWMIKPAGKDLASLDGVVLVKSGDIIMLEHVATGRNLHSHKEPAPSSKHQYQVSGYGLKGQGDANDYWLLEMDGKDNGEKIETVRSKIRLIHYHVKCALYSHDKKLPKWGYDQLEVTCHPNAKEPNAVWSLEEVIDNRLPNVSFDVYSSTFLEKFLESHAVMTQGNSGLKPKEGEVTSRPWQWPIDYRGQVFSGKNHRVYLLGNPVIFWILLGLKLTFVFIWAVFKVRCKRNLPMKRELRLYCENTFKVSWWLLMGWAIHYAPFWGMARVLYFHHYFPAFLFSAMFGGVMLDFLVTLLCVCMPEETAIRVFHWCILLVIGGLMFSFYLFYPLAYGMDGPMAGEGGMMTRLKWVESWDL